MPNAPHRRQHDLGLEGTAQWLTEWHGEEAFSVERLSVPVPDFAALTSVEIAELDSHSSNRESELHSFLKFAAARWLKEHSRYPETLAAEVICYAPIKERCKGRRFFDGLGGEVDIRSPQVLYDNSFGFPLSFGISLRLDLHSFDIAAEVGGTQPVNLLMPLLEGLADQSLWLPYPAGVRPSGFCRSANGLGAGQAYLVRLKKPPRKRRKRTPEINRLGPHPYPINGNFTAWYVEHHGSDALAHAERQVEIMEMLGDRTAAWNWRVVADDVRHLLGEGSGEMVPPA
jgi:hypothetical protein